MKKSASRTGYAMLLVVGFLVLFLSLLSLAYSQMAAAVRAQTARALQIRRDEGCVCALARGLALLETGSPPSDPYVCSVVINTSAGPRSFTVTFASEGVNSWSVSSVPTAPNAIPPPMPGTFAP
jgi:predicted small integral membrane protein